MAISGDFCVGFPAKSHRLTLRNWAVAASGRPHQSLIPKPPPLAGESARRGRRGTASPPQAAVVKATARVPSEASLLSAIKTAWFAYLKLSANDPVAAPKRAHRNAFGSRDQDARARVKNHCPRIEQRFWDNDFQGDRRAASNTRAISSVAFGFSCAYARTNPKHPVSIIAPYGAAKYGR